MAPNDVDLFNRSPNQDNMLWASLAAELRAQSPSMLSEWENGYERWKSGYKRFRDREERLLFESGEDGGVPELREDLMNYHRRSLATLIDSGTAWLQELDRLALDSDEHKQHRLVLKRRINCLIESLQESMEIWHPIHETAKQQIL